MKNILIIGNNDIGLYNFRKELIEELVPAYQVYFTVPYGKKVEMLKELGAKYHPIEVNRRGTNFKEDYLLFKQYKKLMQQIEPDIVLTYTVKPNIYGGIAAMQLHLPCVATITGLGTALQGSGLKTKLMKALYKFGMNKNKKIFFQNKSNRDFFIENNIIECGRSEVVPGSGVNTDYFSPNRTPHNAINILFIARLMREKGIAEFLEAAKLIKAKNEGVVFQLLGFYDEECYKEKVEGLAAQGIVEYLGVSGDTRTEMAQADCIVLPSYHEGMSNVLLEGASFGLPLIATNISGCKEAIEDGVTGFLCNKQNVESLAEAIEKFLMLDESQRIEMGQKGREKMIREFERKLVIGKYTECIRSILGRE